MGSDGGGRCLYLADWSPVRQKELLELRTRITTVEAQIKSVPTQSQITELIAKLSRTEAQMHGMQEQIAATYRRTENIEAYLLQKK